MSKLSRCLLTLGLPVILVVPACAAPASDAGGAADDGPIATRSDAICFPPVYSGTIQVGKSYVSWQAPVGYQSSCDGRFWTQATLGANTGSYTGFWASTDVRVQTDQATCAITRVSYLLYGKTGASWTPVKPLDVVGGNWDPNGNWCRLNLTYSMTIATAKAYGSFMLGTTANSSSTFFQPINTMGLK
jgi:hypothetical protein